MEAIDEEIVVIIDMVPRNIFLELDQRLMDDTVIDSAEASLQALIRSSSSTMASFEFTPPSTTRGEDDGEHLYFRYKEYVE